MPKSWILLVVFIVSVIGAGAWVYTTPPNGLTNQTGIWFGNNSLDGKNITGDKVDVFSEFGTVIGSYVDSYSCDGSFCVYSPWYAPTYTYAKNMSNGSVVYSGTTFQNVVNSVATEVSNNGGGTIILRANNYSTGRIILKRNVNLVCEKGTILSSISSTGAISSTEDNVSVENCVIMGYNSSTWGINFTGANNTRISNVKIYDTLQNQILLNQSDNFTIRDVYILTAGGLYKDGIHIRDSSNGIISGVRGHTQDDLIAIDADLKDVSNIAVSDVEGSADGAGFALVAGWGTTPRTLSGISAKNMVFHNMGLHASEMTTTTMRTAIMFRGDHGAATGSVYKNIDIDFRLTGWSSTARQVNTGTGVTFNPDTASQSTRFENITINGNINAPDNESVEVTGGNIYKNIELNLDVTNMNFSQAHGVSFTTNNDELDGLTIRGSIEGTGSGFSPVFISGGSGVDIQATTSGGIRAFRLGFTGGKQLVSNSTVHDSIISNVSSEYFNVNNATSSVTVKDNLFTQSGKSATSGNNATVINNFNLAPYYHGSRSSCTAAVTPFGGGDSCYNTTSKAFNFYDGAQWRYYNMTTVNSY